MSLFSYLHSAAGRLLRRNQVEDEMDEELRLHLAERTDDLERSGLSREEAERRARLEFGGQERFKEEMRDALGGAFLETLILDLRYSLRVLRKSPGFTLVSILTLALAIGANAVVFGMLNALILRPLNVPRPESLYMVETQGGSGFQSYPDYADLRDRNRTFEDLAAFGIDAAALDTGDSPARVWVDLVTGNYFKVLGIQPYLGRFISPSDERGPNSAPYIVLTHAYWHIHFQDDRSVIGRVVQLNKHPFTIIGVAPPGFQGTVLFASPDFFLPIVNQEQIAGASALHERWNRSTIFMVLGHLKNGVTPAQATADLNSIESYLEKTYPKEEPVSKLVLARPSLYGHFLGSPVRAFITGLSVLAGLILLAACANLGSLFAARSADRSREVALRLALGAKRTRILRTLFTEAALLSIAGGALGLWASVTLLRALTVWQPVPRFPLHLPMSPDANVYIVALVLAVLSALLFGAVPVRQVLRTDPYQVVKAGSTTAASRRITARDLLLGAQIAICAVLVTSSMVALRGLVRSMHSNFGFNAQNVMLLNTTPSMAGYRGDSVAQMQQSLIRAMERIPGVESVGLVDEPPLYGGGRNTHVFHDDTADLRPSNAATVTYIYKASPDYLRAAGTRLLSGRSFTWHDDKNAPLVAVVNKQFARRMFGAENRAVGSYYKMSDGARLQVIGLVDDGKYFSLAENPHAAMFIPILQSPTPQMWLVVRSHRDPAQLARSMKDAVRDIDRALPSYIATWSSELEFSLFPARMATFSLGVLGMMGAMLSVTGIFGMAAYSVSRRLKELGIRLALGARRKQVLQAALGRAFKLLAFGSAAGLVLGILASRVLASIVYQATPRDPLVLTCVVLAMLFLGLIATWIPAHRALSLDPLTLLRED